MTSPAKTFKIALLGAGSVGSQVAKRLMTEQQEFAQRSGVALELIGIAVRDINAQRDVELPQQLLTDDAQDLAAKADIVVELMGGKTFAHELVAAALQRGADVVTANKALLAAFGSELEQLAADNGAQLNYEAAVCAAIPIIRPLRQSLAGDNIQKIMGIVNGSTNYILDSMHEQGKSAADAMQLASDLGYLEADPTLDVEGYDAAQKATILARLAFHTEVAEQQVYREGITAVTAADVAVAKAYGQVIKLLATAEKLTGDGGSAVTVGVQPTLISRDHPLAAVHGGQNAVFVSAECAGDLTFAGAGAGGIETASAVLGDIIETARQRAAGSAHATVQLPQEKLPVLAADKVVAKYRIRIAASREGDIPALVRDTFERSGAQLEEVRFIDCDAGEQQLIVNTASVSAGQMQDIIRKLKDVIRQLQGIENAQILSVLRIEI